MSVFLDANIVPRMWRGYDDPGLPVGVYIGNQVQIGDGGGGINQIQFLFKRENTPADGRFYNIEQLNVFQTNTTTTNGFITVDNFETLGPFLIGERAWRFTLVNNGNSQASINSFTDGIPQPLFLGQTARINALESVVNIGAANINAVVLSVTIQGYIWEPRSILAAGGLRRPTDTLYGR